MGVNWDAMQHALPAIWEMASNEEETGIPESYPDFWEKSTIPNTIIPPKVYLQIGRPLKKRNKSAVESDEGMVRGNKLSRAGKSISCDKAPLATQASQTAHTTLFHPLQLHASPTKMTKATVARKMSSS
ncbi:hypothetical protein Tco_0698130 [Tanacetum coccineum]